MLPVRCCHGAPYQQQYARCAATAWPYSRPCAQVRSIQVASYVPFCLPVFRVTILFCYVVLRNPRVLRLSATSTAFTHFLFIILLSLCNVTRAGASPAALHVRHMRRDNGRSG